MKEVLPRADARSDDPPLKPRRYVRRLGMMGFAVAAAWHSTAIAGGTAVAIDRSDAVSDAFHTVAGKETAEETNISRAAYEAFGIRIHPRCATTPGEEPAYIHNDLFGEQTSFMRFEEGTCNNVSSVVGRTELYTNDTLSAVAWDVSVVAHEIGHYIWNPRLPNGDADESSAQCIGAQYTFRVAKALDASDQVAHQLAMRMSALEPKGSAYMIDPHACRPGGSLDKGAPDAYFPGSGPR